MCHRALASASPGIPQRCQTVNTVCPVWGGAALLVPVLDKPLGARYGQPCATWGERRRGGPCAGGVDGKAGDRRDASLSRGAPCGAAGPGGGQGSTCSSASGGDGRPGFWKRLKGYATQAGITRPVSPHTPPPQLRHPSPGGRGRHPEHLTPWGMVISKLRRSIHMSRTRISGRPINGIITPGA